MSESPSVPGLLAELRVLADAFAGAYAAQVCRTSVGAYANCYALSSRFAQWLRHRDVPCEMLHLTGSRVAFPAAAGRWPLCDPLGFEHWVVSAEDWSIDWTARQFAPDATWPKFVVVDALRAMWLRVDVWACAACDPRPADARHCELARPGLEREHRLIAMQTGGAGPFGDPRHDDAQPLRKACRHR